eukprot:GFUD01005008.1.p1 GENE.GFUD01005008.1~~GFUD01005008.1.p1  ORF type:complete len:266 (-),score=90.11 GFUD01005008.1:134-931(-)
MSGLPWNPLKKVSGQLSAKPLLSQGLVSHEDDRELEIAYVKLQDLEENTKKLYKEVKKYEECLTALQKQEEKVASDLSNSTVCQENEELRKLGEQYSSVVYQMGHATDDLVQLSQKTVVDPMKKLTNEFPQIQGAVKRRDLAMQEAQRCQLKYEKMLKLEKTGNNIVKTDQAKRSYLMAKDDFDKANRLLLLELPQFYDRRIDYFQPSLQALIRSQVDYFGESTRLFTHLVSACPDKSSLVTDEEYNKDLEKKMSQIRSLSIVGT